ncbi:MAG: pyridoxamine 5'-phosphate oxidase family protein [Ilumatobacteraceae bacterium]|nr:pyridoxamine 5'-phosphate oxidase family protein [Ilumatobacteraceae bacterium]
MSELSMTVHEREEFLAGLHVGVIAVERPDGPPLAVPVWYSYEPGGDVEVLMDAGSLKGRLLAAAGRATLCAQQEALPYRYVSVEGPVTIEHLSDTAFGAIEAMAIRYLGDELGRAYAASGSPDDEIRVRIRPERWRTVDYAKSAITE